MRTSNPALGSKTFEKFITYEESNAMTLGGTVNKTALLLCLVVGGAGITWRMFFDPWAEAPSVDMGAWVWGSSIAGFLMALVTIFKKEWSPFTSPVYAILEGLCLGGLSAIFEMKYPGIVIQAVSLTFGTLFGLLLAYRSGLIKPSENFKLGVAAATGGIALYYLIGMVLSFWGTQIPLVHNSGPIGIGFSLFVVIVAALNLVLDFDFIENGVAQRAPKYMEWYSAFGLMVTLIWLYVEFLRLLSKTRSRK